MLVRLYSRQIRELLLSKKSNLKETEFVLHEDAPLIQCRLLFKLKHHDNIESAWLGNGTIFARKLSGGDKFKVDIHDDIDIITA